MERGTNMTDYNPIVQVRTTLEPNSPARYVNVETTFDELFIDNPWMEVLREDMKSMLQRTGTYWVDDHTVKITALTG
jgi:5-methylcytosine-specific restriction endonuclease McrBC regulatory subunit McrC